MSSVARHTPVRPRLDEVEQLTTEPASGVLGQHERVGLELRSGCDSHTYAYPITRPVGPVSTHASSVIENRGRIQSSRRSSWVKSGSP